MDVPTGREDATERDDAEPSDAVVTCHETSPGKLVFTERRNTDGWIATDLVVDLEP